MTDHAMTESTWDTVRDVPAEPTTEAGRALGEALPRYFRASAYWRDFEASVPDRIRRIEAEAAAAERERIRAAGLDAERLARALQAEEAFGLLADEDDAPFGDDWWRDRAAIVAREYAAAEAAP